jgi:hypothetical protein
VKRAIHILSIWGAMTLAFTPVDAQTDYFNTDHGRPVVVEDAYPTDRYSFELQLAPVRLERAQGGLYRWGIEPELAYGVLPRTQIEVGLPLAFVDRPRASDPGLAGIRLSILRNLNIETEGLPALGVAADVLLPVGEFAPDRAYPSLKAIATRSFRFARFHLNGQATFGSAPDPSEDVEAPAHELSRWQAGVAIDKASPLKSSLVIADLVARRPIQEEDDLEWTTEAGIRTQLSPRLALDAGVGRRLTGERGWFVTFGAAYAFAVRSLIPVR